MGTIRIRTRNDRATRVPNAFVTANADPDPECIYELEVGRYYLLRAGREIAVAKFDGVSGNTARFSLAKGEPAGAIGHQSVLVISDLGAEEP